MKVLLIIMAMLVLVACNAVTVPVKVISSFFQNVSHEKESALDKSQWKLPGNF